MYDCNYNIGEKYYRPMVDKLDRKYGAGSTNSNSFASSLIDDFPSHRLYSGGRSFDLESLPERRSATGGGRTQNGRSTTSNTAEEEDLEENIMKSMKKLKALRAARSVSADGDDFGINGLSLNGSSSSSAANGFSSRQQQKKLDFSSKILDSVGLNGRAYDDLEEEILKKRTVKIPSLFDEESSSFATKWSKLKDSTFGEATASAGELAAMARARQSRARLADIDNEIDAVNERGAARERRLNNIKALIAGGEDAYPDTFESSYKSKRLSSKATSSSKKVSF